MGEYKVCVHDPDRRATVAPPVRDRWHSTRDEREIWSPEIEFHRDVNFSK